MKRLIYTLLTTLLCCCAAHADRSEKPIKLGFISILTGQYSDAGKAMADAARLSAEDFEAKNPKQKIEFILEDDGGDPKKAISAYLKLKELDHADLILPISTFAIGSLRDRVNRQKDLTLILGNEPYEPADDYIFMVSPAAIPAYHALGEFLAKNHPGEKSLIVTSQNDAMFRFAAAVKSGAGNGASILELPAGTTDFRTIALQIKKIAPAALVLVGFPVDSASLIKELRRIGSLPSLYFDESVINSKSDFTTILGETAFLRESKILKLANSTDAKFIERFQARFNTPPKQWCDYAYDAVQLALLLRDRTSDEAREWLRTNSYSGVSGTISFDSLGLRTPEYSIIPLREHPGFG